MASCSRVLGAVVCRGGFEVNTTIIGGVVFDPSLDPGGGVEAVVLTHGHADHFSYAARLKRRGAEVYAPRHCMAFIENPVVNHMATIGWAGDPPPGIVTPHFRGEGVRVDHAIEEGGILLGGLRVEAVATPGHTPGHLSYILELPAGRLLVAGDTLYGREYLEKFPILYHTNAGALLRSLEAIEGLELDAVVPGHGSPVEGRGEVRRLVEDNIEKVYRMAELVEELLGDECMYFDDVIAAAAGATGLERSSKAYSVLSPSIRSLLLLLGRLGRVGMELRRGVPCWLRQSR